MSKENLNMFSVLAVGMLENVLQSYYNVFFNVKKPFTNTLFSNICRYVNYPHEASFILLGGPMGTLQET